MDVSGQIKDYRPDLALALVVMKNVMVQFRRANFVKADVLIIFFTGGNKLFVERRIFNNYSSSPNGL